MEKIERKKLRQKIEDEKEDQVKEKIEKCKRMNENMGKSIMKERFPKGIALSSYARDNIIYSFPLLSFSFRIPFSFFLSFFLAAGAFFEGKRKREKENEMREKARKKAGECSEKRERNDWRAYWR